MIPQIVIAVFAVAGGYLDGLTGFFVWGGSAFLGILIISALMNLISGGIVPKKIREKTVDDFISMRPEIVNSAYPGSSDDSIRKKVGALLNEIVKEANINKKGPHPDAAWEPGNVSSSGEEVARRQSTGSEEVLVRELVAFLYQHPLWFGA